MRWLGWLAVCACAVACGDACGSDGGTCEGAACTTGASGGAGGAGGSGTATVECPATGVLYGPWSLKFDETSAVVRWDACAPSDTAIVVWPEEGGAELDFMGTQTEAEVTTTYDVFDEVPPDLPGTYYRTEVVVTGLSPHTCYHYRLLADPERAGRFCTAAPAGDPFTFLAIGDTNPAIGDTEGVLAAALARNPDFTVHLGDLQYYASLVESWATWFSSMAPLLEHAPFMPSLGNHEYENMTEFLDYYERLFGGAGFDGPTEYYRFQSGGVWFFSLSTEMDMNAGSPQADWLEAQLADAAAQPGYRFSVVYFHKPWITLADFSQDATARAHFRPLFVQHGVRLVLQGHVHGYERFDDGPITWITSGGGGAALHDMLVKERERPDEAALHVISEKRYHATFFEVTATEIRGTAVSNDDEVLDQFTISLAPTP